MRALALDAMLLDHFFQPIVNRLLKHPSDLVLNSAMGAAVLTIVPNGIWLILNDWVVFRLFLINVVAALATFLACWILARFGRKVIRPGYRNPLRHLLRWVRIGVLISYALFTLAVLYLIYTFAVVYVIYDLGSTLILSNMLAVEPLWAAVFYFVCCDYPPVKPAPKPEQNALLAPG